MESIYWNPSGLQKELGLRDNYYTLPKRELSTREEVEEILSGLGDRLAEPVQFLVIGGAAMLEYGLKDVTKDIHLV